MNSEGKKRDIGGTRALASVMDFPRTPVARKSKRSTHDPAQSLIKKILPSQNRSQVTIFIIIAIVIVGLAVLVYNLVPGIKTLTQADTQSPQGFIEQCLKNEIESVVETISLQGGYFEPEASILYQGNEIAYLCYTTEDFKPCSIQQPMLEQHIESEIKEQIKDDVANCFNQMKASFEEQGYTAGLETGSTTVELLPKRIVSTFTYRLTLTRGETQTYESFNIVLNNNLYELVGITNSILSWEAIYGDAETTTYMNYYRDLKVEKHNQVDGSTIYILTDRNQGNKFQFASRSNAIPPGWSSG